MFWTGKKCCFPITLGINSKILLKATSVHATDKRHGWTLYIFIPGRENKNAKKQHYPYERKNIHIYFSGSYEHFLKCQDNPEAFLCDSILSQIHSQLYRCSIYLEWDPNGVQKTAYQFLCRNSVSRDSAHTDVPYKTISTFQIYKWYIATLLCILLLLLEYEFNFSNKNNNDIQL